MAHTANPPLVEVTRSGAVESFHRGACAVVHASGEIVHAWGDVEALVFPRSALKPIQALPLIETGAAAACAASDAEIALACSSHNSEATHVGAVRAWLQRLGLGEKDLECGPRDGGRAEAISLDVTKNLCRSGETFTRAHNNCSGKHSGFLATAMHMNEPTVGYIEPNHPVQRRVTQTIEDMTGVSLSAAPCGGDGCGIPVFAFPLVALARGMARMTADDLGDARGAAAKRILHAMSAHPHHVAGTGRFDTRVMEACADSLIVKGGAEGVHIAIAPSRKIAVALKVDDGAIRGSELAMGAVLEALGLFSADQRTALGDLIETPILNTIGRPVGALRKSKDFSV